MQKITVIFMLLLFGCVQVFAQEMVVDIEVTGNINSDRELIVSVLNFEVGSFITKETVASSIRNLHQLRIFADIIISREEIPGGIRVIVQVEEHPIINSQKIQGNRAIRRGRLEDLLLTEEGGYLTPYRSIDSINNLKNEYASRGYNYVSISYETKEVEPGLVDVVINIDEGDRIAIRRIHIHGNREISNRQILGKMKTKRRSLLRSGRFEEEKFNEDLNSIIEFFNKNGFIDARIVSWNSELVEPGMLEINIYLYEGRQYHFGKIALRGNERFTDKAILNNVTIREGEIFDKEKFEDQIGRIASMYYEEGYIYAGFVHHPQRVGNKINITLEITENTRAKIRRIFITGNRKTKEKVIRRQMTIAPGDYFRQSRIIRSQQNIYNMGVFEPNIKLDYQPINQQGDIDLLIELEDRGAGSANVGAGYNSQDKLFGQLSLSHNNVMGNLWQAGVMWEFGGSRQNFQFDFTNPYFYDTNTLVGFNLYHTRRDWTNFNYKIFTNGFSLRLGRGVYFLEHGRIVGNYSLYSKRYEIVRPDIETNEFLIELDSKGRQYTSSFSLTFSRDSRDNIFYPTSGTQFTLYSELAGGPLGGDFDYFKQIAQVNWYTRVYWKLVLRSKWRLGYVTHYGSTREVPPDEKFYLGGTGPDGLRGYPDRSIPARSADGGLRAILHSTEFTVPIAGDQISALWFFDAGNCFNRFTEFNFSDFRKGTGLGIRIQSPFGLLGFDYAYNLDLREWEPHFQFGTGF